MSCDRLKPPPCGNTSKCLPGDRHSMPKDRLKPPICSKSVESNESRMIRLSIHSGSDEISAKSKNSAPHGEAAAKRSAASEADDRRLDAKRACFESSPNGSQSKLFSISKVKENMQN